MGVGESKKVDFIVDAYSQLRISGLTVDPTPDDLELALMRLENMAAEWKARNICSEYNFEDEPDPNSETWVAREYWQAFATNLAVRLIPDFNKQVPAMLMSQASQSLSMISTVTGLKRLNQVSAPTRQPLGSGNSFRFNRWWRFYRSANTAPNSCTTNIMVIGDVEDFFEDFSTYLRDNEVISTYNIVTEPNLELVSDSLNADGDRIDYRIKALSGNDNSDIGNRQVTIAVKTDTGRVETRFIYFDIKPDPASAADNL